MEHDFSFPSQERLKSRAAISRLFQSGKVAKKYPLILRYASASEDEPGLKAAFVVPKKRLAKAIQRNRVKRQIRECYRLNRKQLLGEQSLHLMFIYTGNYPASSTAIESAMTKLLSQLSKAV